MRAILLGTVLASFVAANLAQARAEAPFMDGFPMVTPWAGVGGGVLDLREPLSAPSKCSESAHPYFCAVLRLRAQ